MGGCVCRYRVLFVFALDLAHHIQVVNIVVTLADKATRGRTAEAALMLGVWPSIQSLVLFNVMPVEVVGRWEKLGW